MGFTSVDTRWSPAVIVSKAVGMSGFSQSPEVSAEII